MVGDLLEVQGNENCCMNRQPNRDSVYCSPCWEHDNRLDHDYIQIHFQHRYEDDCHNRLDCNAENNQDKKYVLFNISKFQKSF